MGSITVSHSFTTTRPRREVYELLDDLAAHERFTDHFMVDWRPLTPSTRGAGAAVRVRVKGAGRHDQAEFRVLESTEARIREEGRGGKDLARRSTGTYELETTPEGGTRVTFVAEVFPETLGDRLGAPVARAYLNRMNGKAMRRLQEMLEAG